MFSQTRTALEQFDNQHDFERMSADILNALGYRDVVPIAPRGGSDGGKDITFTTESSGKGLACVTLRKDIEKKFDEDFSQRQAGEFEKYILFCTAYLTTEKKRRFAKYCLNTLEAEFVPQDIEALRSLLDSLLKGIREVYLGIKEIPEEDANKKENRIVLYEKYEELYDLCEEVTKWAKNEIEEWLMLLDDGRVYPTKEKKVECPIEKLTLFTNAYAPSLSEKLIDVRIIIEHLRDYEIYFPEGHWDVFEGDVRNILIETSRKLNYWHEYFVSSLGWLMQEQVKHIT